MIGFTPIIVLRLMMTALDIFGHLLLDYGFSLIRGYPECGTRAAGETNNEGGVPNGIQRIFRQHGI